MSKIFIRFVCHNKFDKKEHYFKKKSRKLFTGLLSIYFILKLKFQFKIKKKEKKENHRHRNCSLHTYMFVQCF